MLPIHQITIRKLILLIGLGVACVSCQQSQAASLWFRENSGLSSFPVPGLDHVGFEFGGTVYESHPGYEKPPFPRIAYWDPDKNQSVLVPNSPGIQSYHTLGSFKWASPFPATSNTKRTLEVPLDPVIGSKMLDAILFELGPAGYPSLLDLDSLLLSSNQKGANGTFTCCGLIEAAAELAGVNCGQGFVPNVCEVLLTPSLVYSFATNPSLKEFAEFYSCGTLFDKAWLGGFFDPVDFMITDPLGRRIGHTATLGTINEIPGAVMTDEGALGQLLNMAFPTPGTYEVVLFGLDDVAKVKLQNGDETKFEFDGFLAVGQTVTHRFTVVPEPSSMMLCACGACVLLLGARARRRLCLRR
jgi:hypothetical protein